jgi:DHA1 family multidrug resistance protein-like MFS transporter
MAEKKPYPEPESEQNPSTGDTEKTPDDTVMEAVFGNPSELENGNLSSSNWSSSGLSDNQSVPTQVAQPTRIKVIFEENDPENPMKWKFSKKAIHTAMYGITTFAAQYNSTTMSPTVPLLMKEFHTNETVATLATSLYVLGIAFGPMFFAPFSEMFGRKIGVFLPFFISVVFTAGSSGSSNMAAILCTRFFAGVFAGAPIVSSGGVLADIWVPAVRGISLVFYAFFVVSGTTFGPIFSSLLVNQGHRSWRWPLWLVMIVDGIILAIDVLVLSETYAPIILKRRATRLRKETGNQTYYAQHEEFRLDFKEYISLHLLRPFAMLATPIVFFIAMFASYVFGILYLVVTSVPVAFELSYNWKGTVTTLPLSAVAMGAWCGGFINILCQIEYGKQVRANNNEPLPEKRFIPMMYFGWLMPAGLMMFAWSAGRTHWIVPFLGIGIMSSGFFIIFQNCLNYLVDAFTRFAASAIAANTFTRSVFGAVFPLFGTQIFTKLGVSWGGSTLAFIALGMLPIPFIFYAFGEKIRSRNPYIKLVT